jgi:curli biogenesis system outer membrane secretion channel CsgG
MEATMRRSSFKFFALFFLYFIFFAAQADAKPGLAVRVFDNKAEGGTEAPAAAVTDMMTTELFNAGIFNLLEREKLDYVADEIKLGQSGLIDPETAPKVGKVKGAKYMMTGAITVYYYNASGGYVLVPGIAGAGAASKTAYVTLDIRVIDTTTGEIIYAAARQGEAKREAAGILSGFAGFAQGSYGGILATATRDSVVKHVESMKTRTWEE